MTRFASSDTQQLTRASFEPVAVQRLRRRLPLLVLGLVVLLAAVAGLTDIEQRIAGPLRVAELARRNGALEAEIERTRLELEMEQATRAELERQINGLNAQVSELTHQIGFLNSRAPK